MNVQNVRFSNVRFSNGFGIQMFGIRAPTVDGIKTLILNIRLEIYYANTYSFFLGWRVDRRLVPYLQQEGSALG